LREKKRLLEIDEISKKWLFFSLSRFPIVTKRLSLFIPPSHRIKITVLHLYPRSFSLTLPSYQKEKQNQTKKRRFSHNFYNVQKKL